jgi:hypothetical protein
MVFTNVFRMLTSALYFSSSCIISFCLDNTAVYNTGSPCQVQKGHSKYIL